MKQLIVHLAIFGVLLFISCSNSEHYEIAKKFKSVVDNENCQVDYFYPKFIEKESNLGLTELNEILEQYVDYERYARRCDENISEKSIIKGDYQITLKREDRISIEFITSIIHYGGNRFDTVFHSIVLNPKNFDKRKISYIYQDPGLLIPNFDRGNLYKYVEQYNKKKNQSNVNLLAYESGSKYVITWGLSENEFLLYVGGEGEWNGNHKIRIPIRETKKDTNR